MNITFKPADRTTSLVIFRHEGFDGQWSVSQPVMPGASAGLYLQAQHSLCTP